MKQGRVIRSGVQTSRGLHARCLWTALLQLEELLPLEADAKRVVLRDYRAALVRAYPELKLSEVDLQQQIAEEDGDAIED